MCFLALLNFESTLPKELILETAGAFLVAF